MEGQKTRSACVRCHRKLSDPVSVKRGMGPFCWKLSNGDVFEKDLEASPEEWARREQHLRNGGEIDLGCNWQYIDHDPDKVLQLPLTMRVSVRYKDGAFEAYGTIFKPGKNEEVVFARCADIRDAYHAAVLAGPESNARAYAARKAALRAAKARQRREVA